jgi:hypothetical protein
MDPLDGMMPKNVDFHEPSWLRDGRISLATFTKIMRNVFISFLVLYLLLSLVVPGGA